MKFPARAIVLACVVTTSICLYLLARPAPIAEPQTPDAVPASQPPQPGQTGMEKDYVAHVIRDDGSEGVIVAVPRLKHLFNEERYKKAMDLQTRGAFHEAEQLYREILSETPDEIFALNGLGTTLFYQHRMRDSEDTFRQIAAMDAQEPSAYLGLAAIAMVRDDKEGAISQFTKAIALKPDSAQAYHGRGTLRHQLGDLDGAASDLQKVVDLLPAQDPYARQAKDLLIQIHARPNGTASSHP